MRESCKGKSFKAAFKSAEKIFQNRLATFFGFLALDIAGVKAPAKMLNLAGHESDLRDADETAESTNGVQYSSPNEIGRLALTNRLI